MTKKTTVLLLILGLLAGVVDAQSFYTRRQNRSLVGSAGTGFASYFGELNNPKDRFDTKLNMDFGLEYKIDGRFSARANVLWFRLEGSDQESGYASIAPRNLSFRSDNVELSASGVVQWLKDGQRFYQRNQLNLYLFAGFGLAWYHPTAVAPESYNGILLEDGGKRVGLRALATEGTKYTPITAIFPFGLGARAMLTPTINIAVEGGYRYTSTDYLDDVSTVHVDPSSFGDNFLAAAMSDRAQEIGLEPREAGKIRGNPDKNDGYFILNVKVEYYLPSNLFTLNGGKKTRQPKRKYRSSRPRRR